MAAGWRKGGEKVATYLRTHDTDETDGRSSFAIAQEALPRHLRTFSLNEGTGCWEWTGFRFDYQGRAREGYGGVYTDEKNRKGRAAHRAVYEALVGPIPEGLVIDHLCRNKGCVNPAHLEPVTHRENIRRIPSHLRGSKGFTGGSLVADYLRARRAAGFNTPKEYAGILGRYIKPLIDSGAWDEAELREAVRRFAGTNRHPRFVAEWCSQVVTEREVRAHEQSKAEAAERSHPKESAPRSIAEILRGAA